jgi:hypothetical protein
VILDTSNSPKSFDPMVKDCNYQIHSSKHNKSHIKPFQRLENVQIFFISNQTACSQSHLNEICKWVTLFACLQAHSNNFCKRVVLLASPIQTWLLVCNLVQTNFANKWFWIYSLLFFQKKIRVPCSNAHVQSAPHSAQSPLPLHHNVVSNKWGFKIK